MGGYYVSCSRRDGADLGRRIDALLDRGCFDMTDYSIGFLQRSQHRSKTSVHEHGVLVAVRPRPTSGWLHPFTENKGHSLNESPSLPELGG